MKNKNSNIVFLTPGFAESEQDSISIPALQIYIKSLRKALPDCKMTLLTFQFPYTTEKYDWNGIEVIPLNGKLMRLKKIFIWEKAFQILRRLHKKQSITCIHSFWIGECSKVGVRFSKKHNIQHVTTVMGQDARLGNRYVKFLVNSKTRLVTLSENHKRILLENYGLKSTLIPWFLESRVFPELEKPSIDILGVGSLIPIKNYPLFIRIVGELVKKRPALKVEIIGGGKDQKKLKNLIREANLLEAIQLKGILSREEVFRKMARAKILLHTSSYESFGYVFLEALNSGMSIVSKNVGFATAIPKWFVTITEKEMVEACQQILNKELQKKERILISSEKESLEAYLKLYHE